MPVKPTTQEEAYFARQEGEKKRRAAESTALRAQQQAREELKARHWMHCPKCGSQLAEISHGEQRIDRCAACGGVWLDAGELEAIARKEGGLLQGLVNVFRG